MLGYHHKQTIKLSPTTHFRIIEAVNNGKTNLHWGFLEGAGGSAGTSASRLFPTGSGFSRAAAGGGWASPSASGASSGSVRLTLGSGGTAAGVGAAGRRSDSQPFPLGNPTLMEGAAGTARGAGGRAGGSSDCQRKKGLGFNFVVLFSTFSTPFPAFPSISK